MDSDDLMLRVTLGALQCSILLRGESAKVLLQIVTETGGKHWSGWPLTDLKDGFSLFETFGRQKKFCM